MSDTSPPKPTMVFGGKVRRRLTSVKRARDPYDAEVRVLATQSVLMVVDLLYLDYLPPPRLRH
jgi:hypothetical protein